MPQLYWCEVLLLLLVGCQAQLIGFNWGTRTSHRLYPPDVVTMLTTNKVARVKLLEPDASIMKALGGSSLEVMLEIPNSMVELLAASEEAAQDWVEQNVTSYLKLRKRFVNIRYVSVGNEPFQSGISEGVILAALQHIQQSLDDQHTKVKATVPFSQGDVQTDFSLQPSTGAFRYPEQVRGVLNALSHAGAPFTVNIHPFFSNLLDNNFPLEFSFFDNAFAPLQDGSLSYTNAFDATFDSVVSALEHAGFPKMKIIVGETGWPTDCERVANLVNARKFNQGLLGKLLSGQGTPRRPESPLHYVFTLFDEDIRSTTPGNFERHWGVFFYDGKPKYELQTRTGSLTEVPNVEYLPRTWCVYDETKHATDDVLANRIAAACMFADCTPLYGNGSCSLLAPQLRASYAFNSEYQFNDQGFWSCDYDYGKFVNMLEESVIGDCRFNLQIRVNSAKIIDPSIRPSLVLFILQVVFCLNFF